jgi:periodic tryptophan protein 2
LAIRIKAIKFSPDGTSFAAATTEGLVIYSLHTEDVFKPYDIDESVTIENVIHHIKEE